MIDFLILNAPSPLTLYFLNKSHWVKLYNLFNMMLSLTCWHLVQNFYIVFTKDFGLYFSFVLMLTLISVSVSG